MLRIDPSYPMDADVQTFLRHFDEPITSRVLEIGANEERAACIIVDNGYDVLGVDLRARDEKVKYHHLQADFTEAYRFLRADCIFSLSALEHFGLGTYPGCSLDPCLDAKAIGCMWHVLPHNGTIYLTVPYGRDYIVAGKDWRVYNRLELERRIIQGLKVEQRIYFKSADAPGCPDVDGIVSEEDADNWHGRQPHVTVFLKLRKV